MLQSRPSRDAEPSRPAPSFFSTEQVGRRSSASNNASSRSSFLRKISPTSFFNNSSSHSSSSARNSIDSQSDFTADYLNNLRKNRPPRPSGARPLPTRNAVAAAAIERDAPPRAGSAMAVRPRIAEQDLPDRAVSAIGHRRAQSSIANLEEAGRPLVRQPYPNVKSRDFSGATATTNTTTETKDTTSTNQTRSSMSIEPKKYSIPYYERGQRWMEKQEASSLRHALEDKDKMDEIRIHAAAQDEAAELVWKHQHPEESRVPYKNPDVGYRQHLRKGSHARSQSIGPYTTLYVKKAGSDGHRSASDGSNTSGGGRNFSGGSNSSGGSPAEGDEERVGRELGKSKGYGSLKDRFSISGPRAFMRRRSSSAKSRKTSGESHKSGVFSNPNDHIYEEPEDPSTTAATAASRPNSNQPQPLGPKARNTSYGSQGIEDKLDRSSTEPIKLISSIDIHKNPPSQSRNAGYKRNGYPDRAETASEPPRMRNGKEIRDDELRAATSKQAKDRSGRLPMPTVVSDRPGRPIVSFANDYRPREMELREQSSSRPSTRDGKSGSRPGSGPRPPSEPIPVPAVNVPSAPSIQINNAPTIQVNSPPEVNISPSIPAIHVPSNNSPAAANIPTSSARPLPAPTRAPRRSTTHISPAASSGPATYRSSNNGAQCSACALPISGRIVRAAQQPFHPACFTCHACATALECVAFYPEPDATRADRVARIRSRFNGTFDADVPLEQRGFTEAEDGDEGLRFYCHLDFHELFSPRCRSCKTPIEGEVVLAAGGAWHVDHFFCAECGDVFGPDTPFVEKDGFAWCTGCHTQRFSGKCAGCRKAIVDVVVKALDREWHEGCFVCCECGGGFEGGGYFVRSEGRLEGMPVCRGCEERRLKA